MCKGHVHMGMGILAALGQGVDTTTASFYLPL